MTVRERIYVIKLLEKKDYADYLMELGVSVKTKVVRGDVYEEIKDDNSIFEGR
jgi:hypothetical protein